MGSHLILFISRVLLKQATTIRRKMKDLFFIFVWLEACNLLPSNGTGTILQCTPAKPPSHPPRFHRRFLPVLPHPEKVPPKSSPQSFANQWIFKMAASMIKVVHQVNFCRFLHPAVRLGQLYSTESSPSVVGKQDKALEVVEDEAKVEKCIKREYTFCLWTSIQCCYCSLLVKFI